ncbi:S-formylglutathione hydrolase [Sporothrix schenckii 1099-18]|uniref:S-formylglutathione hydrolase n=2 Tax=Sporothrix schenckii TaxID=29908 RepID=U7PQM8_SPOS1|nr:S-formylglutathione hydrolase [Sporothrix schenckii 1099-18]ERS97251.1 S-formylglutathione hydrolase [Sporothrix schenckii ATCC 58251]KJR86480.1 S-formylglutathione hydrolase [Sporothrix schenckii 1099-18]
MAFTTKATIATFGGKLLKLSHASKTTGTDMNVNIFLPGPVADAAAATTKAPVLYYLAGLTCSPENGSEKGFLHATAARHGIAIVYPDTSPRGLDLPQEHDDWDFGEAASFYLDAAASSPYSAHYRMETYLTQELPALLADAFPTQLDGDRQSITGHSMGGHGALTLYLRHPGRYRSVSAFAPIANPTRCPWGQKAFKGYLGPADLAITPESASDSTIPAAWKEHDATELIGTWTHGDLKMLVDVGTGDKFYASKQLLPENLEAAVKKAGLTGLTLRYQKDYDHSYYFISTFGQDHVDHAAKYLLA